MVKALIEPKDKSLLADRLRPPRSPSRDERRLRAPRRKRGFSLASGEPSESFFSKIRPSLRESRIRGSRVLVHCGFWVNPLPLPGKGHDRSGGARLELRP